MVGKFLEQNDEMFPRAHLLDLDTQVRILTRDIPKQFIVLLRKSSPLAVYVCSPWISEFSDPGMDFVKILSQKNASVRIFTRPPTNRETVELLQRLKDSAGAQIFVSRSLHAKVYVIEGQKEKYVILGSANFTKEARGNIEISLQISNNDLIMKRIIYSLLSYLRPLCKRWR